MMWPWERGRKVDGRKGRRLKGTVLRRKERNKVERYMMSEKGRRIKWAKGL